MATMEQILQKLLLPDNTSISEGTAQLREALRNTDAIPALCSVIGISSDLKIRQLAAVILRKKLTKHRYCVKLPLETKQFLKQGLMQALVSEQEKAVKISIAQVIAVLTRHIIPEGGWPELMDFVQKMTLSENVNDKELGLFTLQVLTDMAGEQFLEHAHSFASLFYNILTSEQSHDTNVSYLSLLCLINFVPAVDGDQTMVNYYHKMMPHILSTIYSLSRKRPDRAVEVFSLLDELADNAFLVIFPHLRDIIQTCLNLCQEGTTSSEDLQIKALNIIGLLVQSKKKQIVKLKVVESILDVLFALICKPQQDNCDEYFQGNDDSSSPSNVAYQTLDVLALHLPPEELLPTLMSKYITVSLNNQNPHVRKAAYVALAVVAEGCAEYVKQHLMDTFISSVMAGLKDPEMVVNNAALFAVGQFSEHLQPNISVHASVFVPFLLEHLQKISNNEEVREQKVKRIFYALETFCENLNEELLPFLPQLMHYLNPLLSAPYPVKVRQLAISAVGACGNAVKEAMLPYFPTIMENLKAYLTEVQEAETLCLQVQSLDTLGIFARTIGNDTFRPMAREGVELGIQLINKTADPDLRKSAYGLFASISCVLKAEMEPFLPTIMEVILEAVKSDSGIVAYQKEDNHPSVGLFDDAMSDSDEDAEEDLGNTSDVSDDDDENGVHATVENAYLEEKEEAITAIKDLAENCSTVFMPFVDTSFQEILKMLNFPDDDIRSAAITTLAQLCIVIHESNSDAGRAALLKALDVMVPKCAEIIRTDQERDVVSSCLDAFLELLMKVGPAVLEGEGHADAIINSVKDVLNSRTECQDEGGECGESEGDELLVESAGEIIPVLGRVMDPRLFAQHYSQFLPMFFNLTKKQASDSQRSFGVGMIAECMACAGDNLQTYGAQLHNLLVTLASDSNTEVRNNAIYALGEFVLHGRETIYPYYNEILQALSVAVRNETHAGVLDNVCGAIARLIISNVSLVPLDQVVPVFISYLPLREDYEENKWVFQALSQLYQLGCQPLLQNLKPVIKASIDTLHHNHIESENQSLVLNLLKSCHRDFPAECAAVTANLSEPVALALNQAGL